MDGQLSLFHLGPRNEGVSTIDWSKGGIKSLSIERFKRFQKYEIDFGKISLLVGTNSSGKTTILQAVRLFFWCIGKCLVETNGGYILKKAVFPFSDFHLIPAHDIRELSYQGNSPNNKKLRAIIIKGELANGRTLSFKIYTSYSTLMVVDPEPIPEQSLSDMNFIDINRSPLYIPGFFGVVTKELVAHDARLEELLNSGHHNEVLRNIILRLKNEDVRIERLVKILKDEFEISKLDLPFSDKKTEFLKAEYSERGNRIPLDFVSAGSGFLQVLQIMAHALQNPSPILLLDEPDAHMHHGLQQSFLRVLKQFALEEKLQVIMASHSETFLREMDLCDIRAIDSSVEVASKFTSPMELEDNLSDAGVWPSQLELAEILRTKKVLLLESEEDERSFEALGRIKYKDWDIKRKLIQTVFTEGSNDNAVRRLEFITKILKKTISEDVKIAHVRDRDLMCDEAFIGQKSEAKKKNLPLFITDYRNRETMLVNSSLIFKIIACLEKERKGTKVSENEIAKIIDEIIAEWCEEVEDTLPTKIMDYNMPWIKTSFPEDIKAGQIPVNKFIRENWHKKIATNGIPKKLIDGKEILKRVRRKVQEKYNLVLHEKLFYEHMKKQDFDSGLDEAVDLVYSWIK